MDKNEVAQITGMGARKVQYLVTMGAIEPKERGRGKPINYSEQDVIEIVMVDILQQKNLSVLTIKGIFDHLRQEIKKPEYADFYTNDDWGTKKDLMHLRAKVEGGLARRATVEVSMDYDIPEEAMDRIVRKAIGPIFIVPVAKIKIQAKRKLGLIE